MSPESGCARVRPWWLLVALGLAVSLMVMVCLPGGAWRSARAQEPAAAPERATLSMAEARALVARLQRENPLPVEATAPPRDAQGQSPRLWPPLAPPVAPLRAAPKGDIVLASDDEAGTTAAAVAFAIQVNYGEDAVESVCEAGHTFAVTVTDSAGLIKGTARGTTAPIAQWGGQSGFSTNLSGWSFGWPNILPDDRVYAQLVDLGARAEVRVGTISGTLDLAADTVAGQVLTPWFTDTLQGRGEIRVVGGPAISFTVAPTGGLYLLDFGSVGWDLLPGHMVAVSCFEPDGDRVINVFHVATPNLGLFKFVEGINQSAQGGPVVFSISCWNAGDGAGRVFITDTLPANTYYVTDTSGLPVRVVGNRIVWDAGIIPSGDGVSFRVVVTSSASVGTQLTNRVEAATEWDSNLSDNSYTSTWGIRRDIPALFVAKEPRPNDPTPGQIFRYEIACGNDGQVGLGPVWLTDVLPVSTTLVSWRSTYGYTLWREVITTGGKLVLYAPAFPGRLGDIIELELRLDARAPLGRQLVNQVQFAGKLVNASYSDSYVDDQARSSRARHNSRVRKRFVNGKLLPGGDATYEVVVENTGNTIAHGVTLVDELPPDTEYLGEAGEHGGPDLIQGNVLTWNLGDLCVNTEIVIPVPVRIRQGVPPGRVLVNRARVRSRDDEQNSWDDEYVVTTTVRIPGVNLSVDKQAYWETSTRLRYEVRISNIGDQDAHSVVVTDDLPVGSTIANIDLECRLTCRASWQTARFVFSQATLAAGTSSWVIVWIDLPMPQVGSIYVNSAQATSSERDADPADNRIVVRTMAGPELSILKVIRGGSPRPGRLLTYTLHVRNEAAVWGTAGPVRITDTLPSGTTFVAVHQWLCGDTVLCPRTPSYVAGRTVAWDIGALSPASWNDYIITVRLTDTLPARTVLTNTATVLSSNRQDRELDLLNNTSWCTVTVNIGNDIYLPLVIMPPR